MGRSPPSPRGWHSAGRDDARTRRVARSSGCPRRRPRTGVPPWRNLLARASWYGDILYERRSVLKRRDPNQQLEFLLTELVRLQLRVYNNRFRATGLNQSQVAAL